MALVVEDGTGRADANGYISVDDASTYFADRNITAWDSVAEPEAAIILATDFMLNMYRMRWKGFRATIAQALDWPRVYAEKPDANGMGYGTYPNYYLTTEIPSEVKLACAELALRASASSLAPDLSPDDYIKIARVGPISVEYAEYRPLVSLFTSIEQKLAPLFVGSSGVAMIAGR